MHTARFWNGKVFRGQENQIKRPKYDRWLPISYGDES